MLYSKDRSLQCKLFTTFVRLILEFNSFIWSPHLVKDIIAIERVQEYFTKNLKGLSNKTYKERLAILNLLSLECWHVFIDLVSLYKIMHGLSDNKHQQLFPHTVLRIPMLLRKHPHQLDLTKPRSDLLKFNFPYRAVTLWNALPEHIVFAIFITTLKHLLLPHLCSNVLPAM